MRIAIAIVIVMGCSSTATPAPTPAHRHAGDRHGIHGMVLFGRAHHYLEHIPMFRSPHDEQLILRVALRDGAGAPIATDFSDTAYTVKPAAPFSLDDLANKRLATFRGDVYRGNFEDGGTVLVTGATITVEDVLVARRLPGAEPIADGEQEYLLVGAPGDAYLTNVIREGRGFQQILRIASLAGFMPSPAKVQRVTTKSATRLGAPAVPAAAVEAMAGSTRVYLVVGAELWCLTAPEFVERCR